MNRRELADPSIGLIDLDCEQLLSPAEDQHLLLFTAPPGSANAAQLELLRVVGRELFPGLPATADARER